MGSFLISCWKSGPNPTSIAVCQIVYPLILRDLSWSVGYVLAPLRGWTTVCEMAETDSTDEALCLRNPVAGFIGGPSNLSRKCVLSLSTAYLLCGLEEANKRLTGLIDPSRRGSLVEPRSSPCWWGGVKVGALSDTNVALSHIRIYVHGMGSNVGPFVIAVRISLSLLAGTISTNDLIMDTAVLQAHRASAGVLIRSSQYLWSSPVRRS